MSVNDDYAVFKDPKRTRYRVVCRVETVIKPPIATGSCRQNPKTRFSQELTIHSYGLH